MDVLAPFVIILTIAFLIFWVSQILDLMRRRDNEFPGHFDKLIWAIVMVFVPVLGVITYCFWKPYNFVAESPDSLRRELAAIKLAAMKAGRVTEHGDAGQAS